MPSHVFPGLIQISFKSTRVINTQILAFCVLFRHGLAWPFSDPRPWSTVTSYYQGFQGSSAQEEKKKGES